MRGERRRRATAVDGDRHHQRHDHNEPRDAPTGPDTPPTVVTKLDANTASANQMRAAFAAAGILGAAEWAAAIEDGRPYPAGDASWSKLRGVLTKAGAPSASIEQIITLLTR